jgi:hypothetical protein
VAATVLQAAVIFIRRLRRLRRVTVAVQARWRMVTAASWAGGGLPGIGEVCWPGAVVTEVLARRDQLESEEREERAEAAGPTIVALIYL